MKQKIEELIPILLDEYKKLKQDFLNELNINNSDFIDKSISSIKSEELCGAIRRISELRNVLDLIEKKMLSQGK